MRISDLSRASGVSIPTLKYYRRAGLLPPGTATAPRQADYAETHVRRLRLIRTLTDIGGMSLRAVRRVLDAVDDEQLETHELLGVAHHALDPVTDDPAPDLVEARADVDRFLDELGWHVSGQAPARWTLAHALATLRGMGRDAGPEVFERYAAAADQLASEEVSGVAATVSRTDAIERVVVGTVVFEAALVALRRLAQEHHSARRHPSSVTGGS